jgi:hypothetical protein
MSRLSDDQSLSISIASRMPKGTHIRQHPPASARNHSRCGRLCVPENLNPDVLVMQPAKSAVRPDASDLLNQARDRRPLKS